MEQRALLPLAIMERLLKTAGNLRVSDGAKKELSHSLENLARAIAQRASKYASHAGRKTIKAGDVRLAVDTTETFK